MKPAVWQYEDSEKQMVHFRGYVKTYQGATLTRHPCAEVRKNKWQAMEDAKKLLLKLRKSACSQPKTSVETPSN